MLHLEDGPSRRSVPALPCAAVPGLVPACAWGRRKATHRGLHPGDPSRGSGRDQSYCLPWVGCLLLCSHHGLPCWGHPL